jgi:hypothetical protein
MHDPSNPVGPLFTQYRRNPLKRLPTMYQNRQATGDRYPQLRAERPFLHVQRRRISGIKTYFTNCDPLPGTFLQPVKNQVVHTSSVHRMKAIRRLDAGILRRQRRHAGPAIGVHARNDKTAHSCRDRFLHNL